MVLGHDWGGVVRRGGRWPASIMVVHGRWWHCCGGSHDKSRSMNKSLDRFAVVVQVFRVFQRVGGKGFSCAMDSVL